MTENETIRKLQNALRYFEHVGNAEAVRRTRRLLDRRTGRAAGSTTE